MVALPVLSAPFCSVECDSVMPAELFARVSELPGVPSAAAVTVSTAAATE